MSSPSPTAPKNRAADSHEIRALTGIRGVAAVWVVAVHSWPGYMLMFPVLGDIYRPISRGPLGVDLFFILSGFILSYVYAAGNLKFGFREYGRFIWYRIARIFPNYWITLLFLIVLVTSSRFLHVPLTGNYPFSRLVFHATLTQEWPFIGPSPPRTWVNTAWSLSAEWFAYLFVFPVVAFIQRRKWGALPSLVTLYAALSLRLLGGGFVLQYVPLQGVWSGIGDFFAGGLTFSVFFNGGPITQFCQKYASLLALAIIAIVTFCDLPPIWQWALPVFLMPLLLLGLTSNSSWASQFLSTPLVIWLGKISYALYISHTVAQKVLKILIFSGHYERHSTFVKLLFILIGVSTELLFAVLLHYFVEVSARNYMRKIRPWSRLQEVSGRFISRSKAGPNA